MASAAAGPRCPWQGPDHGLSNKDVRDYEAVPIPTPGVLAKVESACSRSLGPSAADLPRLRGFGAKICLATSFCNAWRARPCVTAKTPALGDLVQLPCVSNVEVVGQAAGAGPAPRPLPWARLTGSCRPLPSCPATRNPPPSSAAACTRPLAALPRRPCDARALQVLRQARSASATFVLSRASERSFWP